MRRELDANPGGAEGRGPDLTVPMFVSSNLSGHPAMRGAYSMFERMAGDGISGMEFAALNACDYFGRMIEGRFVRVVEERDPSISLRVEAHAMEIARKAGEIERPIQSAFRMWWLLMLNSREGTSPMLRLSSK